MGVLDVTAGKVAFVKTTKEPVFVLDIQKGNLDDGYYVATIKRPVSTDTNGVVHQVETFMTSELETEEAKILDELRIRKFAHEQNQLAASEARTPAQPAGDPLVN